MIQTVLEEQGVSYRQTRLCRKNDLRTGNPSQSLFPTGQFQKVETPTLLRLAHRLCQHQETCPLRTMFIASNPLKVRRAVWNEPNPIPGFVNRAKEAVILFHSVVQIFDLS